MNYLTIFFLTFNCTFSLLRAYLNHDMPMLLLLLLIYMIYALLSCNIPKQVESPRQLWLEYIIWAVYSAILFGFVYQFSAFAGFAGSFVLYSVAVISSSLTFYLHFIYDTKYGKSEELKGKNVESKNDMSVLEKV